MSIATTRGFPAELGLSGRARWKNPVKPTLSMLYVTASSLSIDLPPVYKYQYVDDLNTFIRQEKYIQFKVKGCNDAHLILSENRNDSFQSYEIVIGGWGDTTSVIRSCRQCQHRAVKYHTPISCTEYKPFWVSWRNGTIRVGEGQEVGTGVFMEWTDPNPHPVKFIGFSSWSDHPTQWMFQKGIHVAWNAKQSMVYVHKMMVCFLKKRMPKKRTE